MSSIKFCNFFGKELGLADFSIFLGVPSSETLNSISNRYSNIQEIWIYSPDRQSVFFDGVKWYRSEDTLLLEMCAKTFNGFLPCVLPIIEDWRNRDRELRLLTLKLTQKNLEGEWLDEVSPVTQRLVQELFK